VNQYLYRVLGGKGALMGETLGGLSEVRARRRLYWVAVIVVWAVLLVALMGFDPDVLKMLPVRT
jgi:hypothetical protein